MHPIMVTKLDVLVLESLVDEAVRCLSQFIPCACHQHLSLTPEHRAKRRHGALARAGLPLERGKQGPSVANKRTLNATGQRLTWTSMSDVDL